MALLLRSDQPDRSVEPEARAIAREFILARMGSLLALLPLGAWTAVHLWNQLAAYDSPEAWQRAVTWHSSSASTALSFIFVLVPLVWHTGWGAVRMLRSRPVVRIGWLSNVRYIVQRLSAIGLLFFLGAHLYLAWFEMRFHTPTLIVYALGVLGISYHLANGLWAWSMAWGVTVSKSGLQWMERVALLLFFLFLALGWLAIYGLYRNG
jgi:succinate dehydrogenase / fumarate reductase cytochrome b subunit